MKLSEMLIALCGWLVSDERALLDFRSLGINPDDWPQGETKRVAQKYIELREKKNHVYAELKLESELKQLGVAKDLPSRSDIQRLYLDALNEATSLELSRALMKHPDRGPELIQAFRFVSPKSDAIHYGVNIQSFVERMESDFQAGMSERELDEWPHLSSMIGGFNPGRVGLIVAKTGFGKTNLASSLALSASKTLSTVFVNMEMAEHDFAQRLMMASGNLSYRQIKGDPTLIMEKILKIQEEHIARRLFFTKGTTLSMFDLESLARRFKANSGLDLLIIDYDQKIELKTSRETPEWKALQLAVEAVERLAKELSIYCLMLAQESGDGDGKMSGSKRSAFPASSVMHFFKDDAGKNIIKATKNRFGKTGAAVEVDYQPERSFVKEVGPYETTDVLGPIPSDIGKRNRRTKAMPHWNKDGG